MPTEAPVRPVPLALLVSLRPRQWTKNLVLLVPLVFARAATDPARVLRALAGVLAFSLVASAVYLLNDLADRERDRLHPAKRLRPIASGQLPPPLARAAAVSLAATGLALSAALGPSVLGCAAGYLALQMLYSYALREVAVVDVFAIAAGFVLRVVAGAEAIDVPISSWLYLCTLLLSLFLALAKRRAELALLGDGDPEAHRRILSEYALPLLDQLITLVSAGTLVCYALYTLAPETVAKFGTDRLKFTIPFALFGLFRYLFLVHRHGEGGQPENVLLGDRQVQLTLLGFLATVAWAIYR